MTEPPPGTFATPGLSPIYVDGMPLNDLVKSLAVNAKGISAQRQTSDNSFWSTTRRVSTDDMREIFEVSLTTTKNINSVSFDLARFPHKAYLFYLEPQTKQWKSILNTSKKPMMLNITDSIPGTITPPAVGSTAHAQHYGAGHWIHYDLVLSPVYTAKLRLVLVRQKTDRIPLDSANHPVAYSLGVRSFNIGYKVKEYTDIPRTRRSAQVITERDSFSSTKDMLGSPVNISVRENRAMDMLRGASWKCEPQPIPNAVVNLYINACDSLGEPQVVDRFMIDPITTGVNMNIYYSNEAPDEIDFFSNDNPLSFPLVRQDSDVVKIDSDGLLFPNNTGYVDIDNAAVMFKTSQPFWMGMVIQPQFDNTETADHVFLDTGSLRLEWNRSALLATLDRVSLIRDNLSFSFNQSLFIILSYDGTLFHLFVQGEDRSVLASSVLPRPAVVTASGMTSLMRLGGLITSAGGDPGHGNFRLRSMILKPESPPEESVYKQYFDDVTAFVMKSEFYGDDQGTTNNAVLRYDPLFQTPGETSINPLGFVGGPNNRYESLTWTPITRDYKLNKGYCVFNPTKAKYFKFEFTNLSPQPYDNYEPVIRKVQVFPTANYYPNINARALMVSGNDAGGGVSVSKDATSTLHYADQVRLKTNTQSAQENSYTPTEALYSQSPLIQERLRAESLYFNLQQWHLSKFCPRFTKTQKHIYEHIEIKHTQRLAYFVGINSISMFRVDYAVDDDTDQYIESFNDTANLAKDSMGNVISGWVVGDDPLVNGGFLTTPNTMGINDLITTESKTFASRRKVTGLQFATQQTPAYQLLDDPDFNESSLSSWIAIGDGVMTASNEFISDIGTMIELNRNAHSRNDWSDLEALWVSWDAIENFDPNPYRPTWDYLEIQQTSFAMGGVQTYDYYKMTPIGRLYAAARVYVNKTLTAPLYIQIIDGSGNVLSEKSYLPEKGQISEWFCSYTIGDGVDVVRLTWQQIEDGGLVPDNDPIHPNWDEMQITGSWDEVDLTNQFLVSDVKVRVVQLEPTDDYWYVDNISLFDDPVVWQFSNDAGLTWYQVYDIRNDPHGCFVFPPSDNEEAGLGLRWRVTGARSQQRINSLVIRPFYDTLPLGQPHRETIQSFGPNQALIDHYSPVTEDPRWKLWHKPVPEDWWFVFRQWLLQFTPKPVDTPRIVASNAITIVNEGSPPTRQALYTDDTKILIGQGTLMKAEFYLDMYRLVIPPSALGD